MSSLQCLHKYSYIFDAQLQKDTCNFNINYLWLCWLQGWDSAPSIVNTCLHSLREYHADFKIKLLDCNTVQNFINIPEHILTKYNQGLISPAHFSDYIRVALLAKYGGTWVDATFFLTDKIPSVIFKQDFFAFKFPPWCGLSVLPDVNVLFSEQTRNIDRNSISNWFMHAKANNRLILLIKIFLEEYWAHENQVFDYFMFHHFVSYAIIKDTECNRIFQNMFELSNAPAHLLQQCLLREFDEQLYHNIIQTTNMHKLIYKPDMQILPNSFMQYLTQYENCH